MILDARFCFWKNAQSTLTLPSKANRHSFKEAQLFTMHGKFLMNWLNERKLMDMLKKFRAFYKGRYIDVIGRETLNLKMLTIDINLICLVSSRRYAIISDAFINSHMNSIDFCDVESCSLHWGCFPSPIWNCFLILTNPFYWRSRWSNGWTSQTKIVTLSYNN